MSLYYIPGATLIPYGIRADYINSSDAFMLNDVNYPPNHLDKSSVNGATKCTIEPCPFEGTEYVIAENRNGPVIGWIGTRRDPDEVATLKKSNANALILTEIDRLEKSITDRMWREDAVDSTALMVVKKRDENGDLVDDTDDPRHVKTATQYIAWVNDAIAELRNQL